ncbi:hypothetical protein BCR39DRAFT_598534 [Naematelia encephala]|uniref:Cupredoxin n=1 Tax=Naematelia encephala TaxID=71784 RepID=A0A1Y2B642_9TREE|nr:hypothetical protein BCR39DRAFT_598534 [Naematelia encephala]
MYVTSNKPGGDGGGGGGSSFYIRTRPDILNDNTTNPTTSIQRPVLGNGHGLIHFDKMIVKALLGILPFIATQSSATGTTSGMSSGDSGSIQAGSPHSDSTSSFSIYDGGRSGSSISGSSGMSGSSGSGMSGDCGSGECGAATTLVESTTITSAAASYSTPIYGSGSTTWGGDLNSCLQASHHIMPDLDSLPDQSCMCQAQFGSGGGGMMSSTPTYESPSTAAATHTVIVAPKQGVLRYVPFAVTANPGDTIHYLWGAGPHSVTLSDGENVCNRSTGPDAFDSGKPIAVNATATFDTVVKDTTPQFHYCTVGNHCLMGMFGIVNPPSTNVTNNLTQLTSSTVSAPAPQGTGELGGVGQCKDNSVDCWVQQWMLGSPDAMNMGKAVRQKCESVPGSWQWGGSWDMSSVISTTTVITKEVIIENIMYSRLTMAFNPSWMSSGAPPSNYIAAPDLQSFVAQSGVANSTTSSSGASTDSPSPTASVGNAAVTTGTAAQASSSATQANNASGGRGHFRTGVFVGAAGVILAAFI